MFEDPPRLVRLRTLSLVPLPLSDRSYFSNGHIVGKYVLASGTCDQFGHMSVMRMLKMHSPQVNLKKRRDR